VLRTLHASRGITLVELMIGLAILALLLGFKLNEAASIGIIGAIDGPTSIYVSGILAPHLLGPITVAAYSYMSLVPIIMPPIMPCGRLNMWYLPIGPMSMVSVGFQPNSSV